MAYEFKALTVVSHNIRDLRPAEKLGIVILTSKELLSKIRNLSKFYQIMARVPDVPPVSGDEL